jgi:hypothetical protein
MLIANNVRERRVEPAAGRVLLILATLVTIG